MFTFLTLHTFSLNDVVERDERGFVSIKLRYFSYRNEVNKTSYLPLKQCSGHKSSSETRCALVWKGRRIYRSMCQSIMKLHTFILVFFINHCPVAWNITHRFVGTAFMMW